MGGSMSSVMSSEMKFTFGHSVALMYMLEKQRVELFRLSMHTQRLKHAGRAASNPPTQRPSWVLSSTRACVSRVRSQSPRAPSST